MPGRAIHEFQKLLQARGLVDGVVARDQPVAVEPQEGAVQRTHAVARAGLEHGIDLLDLAGTDEVAYGRRSGEHLEGQRAAFAVLSPEELLRNINEDFGIASRADSIKDLIDELNLYLLEQNRDGKNCVLVIDEAQNLSPSVLEQIRLLSNLETDSRKLLQIVLMGQPELRDRLNSPRLRQLRQRITVRYHLPPLSRSEVCQYIRHRLHVSGANGVPHFTKPAIWRVCRYSGGIPRLVNGVCDKALLAGFVNQRERIDYRVIGVAIRELEGKIGT